ncbi:MAG: hypothetical protein ABIV28_02185 [Longimicrobiales bacterium]
MNQTDAQPTVLALAADMIFSSKISGAAKAVGTEVRLARSAAQLIELTGQTAPSLIILDLDTRGLDIAGTIQALRSEAPASHILAYVSHVRTDAITEARSAGASRVLARSAFVTSLLEILRVAGHAPEKGDPA